MSEIKRVDPEKRLKELGIELPEVKPIDPNEWNLVYGRQVGNLVFLSGEGPEFPDGSWTSGRLGEDMTIEEGQEAGRVCAINLMASLKSVIGDLNRVKQIVKLLCLVNSTPDFHDQPKVANGCSDLLIDVFGDAGRHARSAIGVTAFYANIPIEVEMIVELWSDEEYEKIKSEK